MKNTLRNLANEAKAEERKIVGRHRRTPTPNEKIAHTAHRAAVHVLHTGQLAWIGLPAIFAFEAARPIWERFVEIPLSSMMFGEHATTHTESIATLTAHFLP
jgi:hypothetical protein